MQCFVSLDAVARARLPANIRRAVARAVQNMLDVHGERYDPAEDGRVVLFGPSTSDDQARQLFGHTWADVTLEGVSYDRETGVFLAVVLLNNQLAHSIIVPDLPWLLRDFRAKLMENLSGKGPP